MIPVNSVPGLSAGYSLMDIPAQAEAAGWHITGEISLRVGSGVKLCNSLLPIQGHQACLSLNTDLGFSTVQVFSRMPKEDQLKFGAFRVWADAAIAKSLPGPQYGSDSDDNDWGW